MLSQERRMERYRALYVWKILEGLTTNCGLETTTSDRRGREVIILPARGKQGIQTLRENSFQVNGARIFNSLPKKIRNLSKIPLDDFKSKLDSYLETLPDEPNLPDYTPSMCNQVTAKPSNSIIDYARTTIRRPGWIDKCRGVIQPPFLLFCYDFQKWIQSIDCNKFTIVKTIVLNKMKIKWTDPNF